MRIGSACLFLVVFLFAVLMGITLLSLNGITGGTGPTKASRKARRIPTPWVKALDRDGDEKCDVCQGRGYIVCDTCDGRGRMPAFLPDQREQDCFACRGAGTHNCDLCEMFKSIAGEE